MGRGEVRMVDTHGSRHKAGTPGDQAEGPTRADEVEQKTSDLVEFRNAGVLTEAEFEEQKAKLRWGVT
jgi:hypothetical protein